MDAISVVETSSCLCACVCLQVTCVSAALVSRGQQLVRWSALMCTLVVLAVGGGGGGCPRVPAVGKPKFVRPLVQK
jgi:hypothetical protein